jgi:hypothetical protein
VAEIHTTGDTDNQDEQRVVREKLRAHGESMPRSAWVGKARLKEGTRAMTRPPAGRLDIMVVRNTRSCQTSYFNPKATGQATASGKG